MSGLWRNVPETREGKYPIVLRRDGTVLDAPYFVLVMRDPGFAAAMLAYAQEVERLGYDPQYVVDCRMAADQADALQQERGAGDPDAPPHRVDDPIIIAWARSLRRNNSL